ncbi:hypothetical protein SADUNF_Sadunf17G0058000 [Salix dunnii]|uniref:Uncharacterized protein n=1 Tax=Salix dunnii TaxID=1413687 RepID=A0A835J545_9ROSI|nr:hypothetical protein SADUNF_Sadunf17G0058000 [Salix dunnii]
MSYQKVPHDPYAPPGYSSSYPPPGYPPSAPPPPPHEGYPPPPPPGYPGYPPPGPPRGYQGYFAEGYPPPPAPPQYQQCCHYEHHHFQDNYDGCSSFIRGCLLAYGILDNAFAKSVVTSPCNFLIMFRRTLLLLYVGVLLLKFQMMYMGSDNSGAAIISANGQLLVLQARTHKRYHLHEVFRKLLSLWDSTSWDDTLNCSRGVRIMKFGIAYYLLRSQEFIRIRFSR